jgi:hypothetical protein
MAREISYFVQASMPAGEEVSTPTHRSPARRKSALRAAERPALSKVSVIACSSTGDPDIGDYDGEQTVIFRQGELPSAFD